MSFGAQKVPGVSFTGVSNKTFSLTSFSSNLTGSATLLTTALASNATSAFSSQQSAVLASVQSTAAASSSPIKAVQNASKSTFVSSIPSPVASAMSSVTSASSAIVPKSADLSASSVASVSSKSLSASSPTAEASSSVAALPSSASPSPLPSAKTAQSNAASPSANVSASPDPSLRTASITSSSTAAANGGLQQVSSAGSSSASGAADSSLSIARSNVINVPGSTIFSTTTDAVSTFSTPVSITVKAQDGKSSVLSAPPLITSVTPSTATDGTVVEVTHVIANPNNGLNTLGRHSSFFDNHGAVIGTFIAAGVVFASLLGVLVCFARRRRRSARRRRLEAMLPTNPFDDSAAPNAPVMVQHVPRDQDFASYGDRSPGVRQPEQAHVYSDLGMGNPGVGQAAGHGDYEGPFSDYHTPRRDSFFGGSAEDEVMDIRPPSRQLSTPSIYPPSVSESDEDSLYQKEVRESLPPPAHVPPSDYVALERVSGRPSTQETQLKALNQQHPPLAPDTPLFVRTVSSMSQGSSQGGHGSVQTPVTPTSESGTLVATEENIKGHPMLPSPPSAFLRRQLSKRTPLGVIVAPTHASQPSVDSMAEVRAGTAL